MRELGWSGCSRRGSRLPARQQVQDRDSLHVRPPHTLERDWRQDVLVAIDDQGLPRHQRLPDVPNRLTAEVARYVDVAAGAEGVARPPPSTGENRPGSAGPPRRGGGLGEL